MATSEYSGNAKYIVLCLGLLIGFVVGFVMLLSSLPIHEGVEGYDAYAVRPAAQQERNFDFYKYLPGNTRAAAKDAIDAPKVETGVTVISGNAVAEQSMRLTAEQAAQVVSPAVPSQSVVTAAASTAVAESVTHAVPANEQALSTTSVNTSVQYSEIPANYAVERSYFLQAGQFGLHQEAQAMRAQVLLLGLEAFIITRVEANGATAHRVRVGPYFDQNLLTEAKKRLRRGGIHYEIVRVTG